MSVCVCVCLCVCVCACACACVCVSVSVSVSVAVSLSVSLSVSVSVSVSVFVSVSVSVCVCLCVCVFGVCISCGGAMALKLCRRAQGGALGGYSNWGSRGPLFEGIAPTGGLRKCRPQNPCGARLRGRA